MDYVSEKYFDKLEKKVEKLDDKVDSLKEDVSVLTNSVKLYTEQVKNHVDSDNKIITEILPAIQGLQLILPDLRNIVLERKSEEIQELKKVKQKTSWKLKLGLISGFTAAVSGVYGVYVLILKFL